VAVAKLPTPAARFVPLALPDAREDRERRARGVSVVDWIDAPPPPEKRWMCEGTEAGCPALRCKLHLGRVGEAAGFSCLDQVAELPEEERTFDLIARVLGTDERAVRLTRDAAFATIEGKSPDVLRALGVRRR